MTNEIARETSSSLRGCTQCVAYLDEIGWSTGRKRKPDRVYQEEVDKMDVNYLRANMVMLMEETRSLRNLPRQLGCLRGVVSTYKVHTTGAFQIQQLSS